MGEWIDAHESRDFLIGMGAVADEERNHDDVRAGSELVPVGDEGGLFHVGVEDGGIAGARGGDEFDLVANGLGGVRVERSAVADDDEGGLGGIDPGGDLFGAAQDEARHGRVDAHGSAIMESFSTDACGRAAEFEFARDDGLGEMALTDEVRHDIDLV